MEKILKIVSLITCAAITLLLLAGCQDGKKLEKVSVCEVTHSIFYAPQYVAINEGFFKDNGIEIEISNGQGADKVMSAVLSNSIDIGFAGPEAAVYVYNEGKEDYAKVFAQMTKRDGSFLMSRQKEENFDWNALKGKTLLPGRKGGVPYMTLEYVVKQKGLVPGKDVVFDDSIQYALMAGAFMSGTGDYVTVFEPTASAMELEGKGYIAASIGEQTEDIPYTTYFAKQSFLKKNTDLVQRFTDALYKGQIWVNTHSAKEIAAAIAPSFADTEKSLIETVVQRYKEIGVWNTDPILTEESFNRLQEVISEAGELDQKAPYGDVVDNTFAQKAIDTVK